MYKNYFKNLKLWAFWTCIGQFIVSFLGFLLLCAGYSFLSLRNGNGDENLYISNYEAYLTLASGLFLLLPFISSMFLIFAVLNKNLRMLNVWLKGISIFSIIYSCSILANGIYLVVAGSTYVSYVAIALSLIFAAFMGHSMLVIYKFSKKYTKKDVNNESEEA